MANTCWNRLTIWGTTAQIRQLIAFFAAYQGEQTILKAGKGCLRVKVESKWQPARALMDNLFAEAPGIWLKNEWYEEGGSAGILVGTQNALQTLTWEEGCLEETIARDADLNSPIAQEFM